MNINTWKRLIKESFVCSSISGVFPNDVTYMINTVMFSKLTNLVVCHMVICQFQSGNLKTENRLISKTYSMNKLSKRVSHKNIKSQMVPFLISNDSCYVSDICMLYYTILIS